jgi:hypothetical protein
VNRRIGHHGAHPGERIELSEVGMFVMTRNHVYRQVGPACKFGVEDIYDDVTAPIGKPALKASKSKRKQPKKKGWSG